LRDEKSIIQNTKKNLSLRKLHSSVAYRNDQFDIIFVVSININSQLLRNAEICRIRYFFFFARVEYNVAPIESENTVLTRLAFCTRVQTCVREQVRRSEPRVGGISVEQSRVKVRTQRALHGNARGCLRSFKLAEYGLVHVGESDEDRRHKIGEVQRSAESIFRKKAELITDIEIFSSILFDEEPNRMKSYNSV